MRVLSHANWARADAEEAATSTEVHDRSIGDLIRESCELSDAQIEQILVYQREHRIRFGEAAVALRLAGKDDVLRALSRQFHYAYTPDLGDRSVNGELVAAASPFSNEAEAFRELRSQLMMGVMGRDDAAARALAVVSPDVGDGKTYVAANMAVAFSQLGGRTLLMDADMRTPRQHKVFDIGRTEGLSSILSGRCQADVVHRVRDLPSLYVLPVGPIPPNPLELVQRPAFGLLLNELLNKFDHVLIDTPAAVHGADARVIAAKSGAALVIGRKGRSRMASMQGLLKSLGKGPGTIAGVVMNEY